MMQVNISVGSTKNDRRGQVDSSLTAMGK